MKSPRTAKQLAGYTLDAGALIGYERQDRRVIDLLAKSVEYGIELVVPAGVVGQVWRNGRLQARLANLLRSPEVEIETLDDMRARAAGQLCGLRGTSDVIDAAVVLCARSRGHHVVTSDPGDLARLDPTLGLIVI
jgi:hypothetical protein